LEKEGIKRSYYTIAWKEALAGVWERGAGTTLSQGGNASPRNRGKI